MAMSIFVLFAALAISASTIAQDLSDITDNDISQVLTRSEDCSPEAIAQCVMPLTSLIGKDDDDVDDEEACDVARGVYYCLKNKVDVCLDSEDQGDLDQIKEDLDQMKNLFPSKCELKEADTCITDETEKLASCASVGIATAVFNFRKTGDNDFERFQCWAYMETIECFMTKVKKNCGLVAAQKVMKKVIDFPPHIKESCKIAPPDNSIKTIYGVGGN